MFVFSSFLPVLMRAYSVKYKYEPSSARESPFPIQIMISGVRTFQERACERESFIRGRAVPRDAEVPLHPGSATSEPGPCLSLCPSHGLTLRNLTTKSFAFAKVS